MIWRRGPFANAQPDGAYCINVAAVGEHSGAAEFFASVGSAAKVVLIFGSFSADRLWRVWHDPRTHPDLVLAAVPMARSAKIGI